MHMILHMWYICILIPSFLWLIYILNINNSANLLLTILYRNQNSRLETRLYHHVCQPQLFWFGGFYTSLWHFDKSFLFKMWFGQIVTLNCLFHLFFVFFRLWQSQWRGGRHCVFVHLAGEPTPPDPTAVTDISSWVEKKKTRHELLASCLSKWRKCLRSAHVWFSAHACESVEWFTYRQ